MQSFKISCHAIGQIMGEIGLTETQKDTLSKLQIREFDTTAKALTDNMKKELNDLRHKLANPELPQTAKTYLHKWYANDKQQLHSKEVKKGLAVENELIDYMAYVLGFGVASKNLFRKSCDFIEGECDVDLGDVVIDVKAPWSKETLHSNIFGMDKDYEWQGRGYMHLFKKESFILFYGLMDTPEEVNYGNLVTYSHLPDNERWVAYTIKHEQSKIDAIVERVKLCRVYLETYDKIIKTKLGNIN